MKYLSVCSGIEAATVAWEPLGWKAVAYSEIEKFPSAVLSHHYPDTPNWGDMTKYKEWPDADINVLVGGTPCQSFSVAGLRKGMADPRGNLALVYLGIVDRYRPNWVVWENVPGVLSSTSHDAPDPCPPPPPVDLGCDGAEMETEDDYDSEETHALNAFLAGLSELGYGYALRVFDAQYFGVAQRRRRVFVVGYLGDWRPAHAVLFERESLRGDSAPRRETRAGTATGFEVGPGAGGFTDLSPTLDARCKDGPIRNQLGIGVAVFGGNNTQGPIDVATALNASATASGRQDFESETFVAQVAPTLQHNGKAAGSATQQDAETGALVAHTLRGEGFDASEDGTVRGTPLVPVPFDTTQMTSAANRSNPKPGDPCHPLAAGAHAPAIAFSANDYGNDATEELSPTLRAGGADRSHANSGNWMAVAVSLRGREGGATAELGGEVCPAIRTGGGGGDKPHVLNNMAVRRLTPRECERLQGFPDDYTLIPWRGKDPQDCPDGPRYKALGNSMAVPVMSWIGERINQVSAIKKSLENKVTP